MHWRRGLAGHEQAHPLLLRQWLQQQQEFLHQRAQVDRLHAQIHAPGLDAGEVQDFLSERA